MKEKEEGRGKRMGEGLYRQPSRTQSKKVRGHLNSQVAHWSRMGSEYLPWVKQLGEGARTPEVSGSPRSGLGEEYLLA